MKTYEAIEVEIKYITADTLTESFDTPIIPGDDSNLIDW